ncbi:MAG: flagellar hook-associated protein FlgK [Deltaproteobacteria bacterium]|nr:flagellar hook-associated protein FlgK [Deltaproteobacteria bacterium]
MSGIGLVLNIAKDALLSQQYAINVVSHNIANVHTEGYSRQRIDLETKDPAVYAGLLFGRGVDIGSITRVADSFIEARLSERESDTASLEAAENYMAVLEGIFNETSENGLSAHMAAFWNAWHDLSNDPSGDTERAMLYERSDMLAEAFKALSTSLDEFVIDLNRSLTNSVEKINEITATIADVNNQIVGMEVDKVANDLRDKRNILLNELSQYIDNKWFEQDNGSITVIVGKGQVMVLGSESYDMSVDGAGVKLEGSGDSTVDLTDSIKGGKLGGWLDMRDEFIPKYKADLDSLAKSFIGEVNKIHTQGVGLSFFDSAITGTYATDATGLLSTLDFGNEIDYSKDLTIWADDGLGNVTEVTVDLTFYGLSGASNITDLRDAINTELGGLSDWASVTTGNALKLDPVLDPNYTYAFSDNGSNLLAALGINTFFQGDDATSMAVNSVIANTDNIAAAKIDATGPPPGIFAVGDNSNALDMADLQYIEVSTERWTYSRGSTPTSTTVSSTLEDYYHTLVSAIGIKSESITRGKAYSESILDKLTEVRNSISGVSIDEEMANLIRFQHAYSAAAKLIAVSDEMLGRLIDVK